MPRSTGRIWIPRTITRLFDLSREGYSQREIARELRRSPKAVECKVAKLRKRIAIMPFPQLAQVISAGALERV